MLFKLKLNLEFTFNLFLIQLFVRLIAWSEIQIPMVKGSLWCCIFDHYVIIFINEIKHVKNNIRAFKKLKMMNQMTLITLN